MCHSPLMKEGPPKNQKNSKTPRIPWITAHPMEKMARRGCQTKGIVWMPRLFENGNERGNKERRKRQDPEIHDKRFP